MYVVINEKLMLANSRTNSPTVHAVGAKVSDKDLSVLSADTVEYLIAAGRIAKIEGEKKNPVNSNKKMKKSANKGAL